MSDSTEVAGLQIAVDATSAVTASAALDKFTAAAVRADAATGRFTGTAGTMAAQTAQMRTAYDDAGRAAQAASVNLSPLTQRLKEQVDLFGKSPAEVAKYRAAQAGLSQEESNLAVGLAKKLSALQEGEAAAKAAAKAEDALRAAVKGSTDVVRLSSTQIRESITILRELSAGRYSRIPGSFSILAQQGNLAALAMKALSSPIVQVGIVGTATAAILGTMAFQAEKAAEGVKLIQTALSATGKSALVSDDQIRQTIDLIQQLHGVNRDEATTSVDALVRAPFADVAQFKEAASILGDLAAALGVKVPEAAKVLSGALESPIEGLRRLQQAHIALTPDQQLTIERLHDEGKEAEATAVLINALQEKTKGLAQQSLTPLQISIQNLGNAWHGASTQISESSVVTGVLTTLTDSFNLMAKAINAIRDGSKDLLKGTVLEELADALAGKTTASTTAAGTTAGPGRVTASTGVEQANTAAKAAAVAQSQATAASLAQEFQRVDKLTQGLRSQAAATEELKVKRDALQKALNTPGEIQDPANRAVFQDRIKAIDEQIAKKDDGGFAAKKLELLQSLNKAQEELTATVNGTTLAEDRGVKATQTWLDNNQKALKISEATKAVLLSIASAADKTNEANKVALETIAIKQRTEGVQSQIDRLTGNTADSQVGAIHKQFDEPLRKDQASASEAPALQADVDIEKSKVDQLLKVAQAADKVLQIENAISVSERANATVSKTAQIEEAAGLISHAAAVQKVLQANLAEASSLQNNVAEYQAQLAVMKDTDPAAEALKEKIGELDLKILELRTHTSELTAAFKGAFEGSVSAGLDGIIERTETTHKAVDDVVKAMEHAAVSTFTKGLTNDLSTLIFRPRGSDAPTGGFAGVLPSVAGLLGIKGAPPTAGAGSAAPITTAFATGSTTASTAITTAFATGAAAVSEAITQALAGAGVSDGSGGLLGLFGLGGGAGIASTGAAAVGTDTGTLADTIPLGLATGGYTGDGATHMPAGIVHGQEFVNRAEVVRQPGALSFLTDFNERGMQAVAGYAGGGFVQGAGFSPIKLQGYAAGGPVKSIDTLPTPSASGGSRVDIGTTINTALNTGGQQAGGTLVDSMAQGGAIAGQTIANSIAGATQPGTGLSAGGANTYSKTNNDKGIFGLVMLAAGLGKSLLKGGSSGVPTVGNSAPSASLTNSVPVNLPSGFAPGGYTGDGGKYQPAGIVHAGEFVHRQEVVSQPGAMQFLTAFNEKGMAAVSSWGGYAQGGTVKEIAFPLSGYADGGAVAGSAYAVPRTFAAIEGPIRGYAEGGPVYQAPSVNMPTVSAPRAWSAGSAPRTPRYAGQGATTPVNLVLSPEMAHTTVADLIDRHLNDAFAKR